MDEEKFRIKLIFPWLLLFGPLLLGCGVVHSFELTAATQLSIPAKISNLSPSATLTLADKAQSFDNADQDCAHQRIRFSGISEESGEDAVGSSASESNIWDVIRQGFSLPLLRDEHVTHYERWYSEHPAYLHRLVERARLYLPFIAQQVSEREYPMEIALLPAIESAFKPNAYSKSHASGLWQFIPATGRRFGLKQNWWYDGRRDVIESTRAALDYLGELNQQFGGDWLLTLAAYNGGEQSVHRAIQNNRNIQQGTEFTDLKLRPESRRYVPKLIAFRNIVSHPQKFGIKLCPISTHTNIAVVATPGQVDLGVVAKLTDLSPQEIFLLNPAQRRWATDPDGPHRIMVPKTRARILENNLAKMNTPEPAKWRRYRVESGETLSSIASRNGVKVYAIKSVNRMKSNRIRINQELLIPISDRRRLPAKLNQFSTIDRHVDSGHEIYRVRDGDTLWRIAQRYKVYVSQLLAWNSLAVDQILELGQKIIIYKN